MLMGVQSGTCLGLLIILSSVSTADVRLALDAKINNQSARLAFDTGASDSFLFRSSAERLGLRIMKVNDQGPLAPGRVHMDRTEECKLDIGSGPQEFAFWVVDLPGQIRPDIDGFISWNDTRNYLIGINVGKPGWGFLEALPSNLNSWAKWKLVPNSECLLFECPNGKESETIGINTGLADGVSFSPQRWMKWRERPGIRPATLCSYVTPADGIIVNEVFRASKIRVGGLELVDMPVTVMSPSAHALLQDCDAALGLYAFRQLRLIIDAKQNALYTQAMRPPAEPYDYNHLGAVFVPKDLQQGDDLVAHVVKDSPAYGMGIRDGDVLLKIGDLNVTAWRTDPSILPLSRFWDQPAGTKLKLTLRRGTKEYETTVTLEDVPAVD